MGKVFEAKGDDRKFRRLTIDSIADADAPLSTYTPLIVLEENPERFRVLVPLASVDECVGYVIRKWKKEMARVWDRLPLRVGVVGFPRKLPFQAVIEATRNIEDELLANPEEWRVEDVNPCGDMTALSFVRPDGGREGVVVPTKLPDGRDDVYYPNFAISPSARVEPHDFNAPQSAGSPTTYRWVAEIEQGDEIAVAPSRFTQLFLDTTARRFEPIRVRALSDWKRQQKIWQIVAKCALSQTAALTVEQSLRETLERWTDISGALNESVWHKWVHAVLVNEWNVSPTEAKELEGAACDGLLENVLNWNLHVLKQKIGENR